MSRPVDLGAEPETLAVLARPPLRRLPLAGGALAVAALALVLLTGPDSGNLGALVLGGSGAALLAAALAGRARAIARESSGLIVVLVLSAVLFAAVLWFSTVTLGGGQLAASFWGVVVGGTLLVRGLGWLRAARAQGRTPWQTLAGGSGLHAAEAAQLVGLLVGGSLFVLGVAIGWSWLRGLLGYGVSARWPGSGSPILLLRFGLVALSGLVIAGTVLAVGRALWRTAAASGAPAPAARDEQVVAAHLHDSVLQTLALIGRSADDPARVRQLARQQERSLRSWLAGRDDAAADSLAAAIRLTAQEVEDEEPGCVVEVVAVGDAPLDRPADAMVRAAREAIRNAVRHGGSPVRVFVEVDGAVREVFVRDTGPGFDLARVDDARRGVRDAIIGRMEHIGGTATIDSGPAGTEIALRFVGAAGEEA